jgi:hypothetical protein
MAEIAITKMPSHLKRIHKEEYSKSSLSSKDKKNSSEAEKERIQDTQQHPESTHPANIK